jgi:hypothetical protein
VVSDFTYVSTGQAWLYVAFVIDVFARRIVGWRVGESTSCSTHWSGRYMQLTSGKKGSLRAIAEEEGLSERYVSRVISGSLLAPDVVEKIVQGRHPVRFTVKSLKLRPPVLWDEHRRKFGVPN